MADSPSTWQLVGREPELQRLEALLDAPGGVVLGGAAGVGKTRLAAEFAAVAKRSGLAVAVATATHPSAALPFGALAPLLPAGLDDAAGRVDARADVLRRFTAGLLERAGDRRLFLVVDDAHLLDDASAVLIHQLAATRRAFIVIALRTGVPAPESVTALWKDDLLERWDLRGLDAGAVGRLLAVALDGAVDPGVAAQLSVRSQGNVLFLTELLRGALAEGVLRSENGLWRLVGRVSLPDRLAEIVAARLADLSRPERDLLEVVAFGEPLGRSELEGLADSGLAGHLERKGLLVSRRDQRRLEVRFAHPLYGEVLRSQVDADRARTISRSLAENIEHRGAQRGEDTLRVAVWRLEGGGADPGLMLRAATVARWRYDFGLAERLARAAVAAGAGFDASLLAAQLAGLQGRSVEAEDELRALAARATIDDERSAVALNRIDNQVFWLGHVDAGLKMADEAEATISDTGFRHEIAARRLGMLSGTAGPRVAADATEPLLASAEGRPLAWASIFGAHGLTRNGRLAAAIDLTERGHEAHLALPRPIDWDACIHLYFRCDALANAGRFAEAEALARREYDQGVADGSPDAQAFFAWYLGKTVEYVGHTEVAIGHLQEAVALFSALGRPQLVQFCLVSLTLAQALAGEPQDAGHSLGAIEALDLPPSVYFAVDLLEARAWVSVARARDNEGRALLLDAARLGREIGDLVGEAAALHGVARLGGARDVTARLDQVAAQTEGDLVPARAFHTAALAAADPDALGIASRRFAAMGADLLAAEASADAATVWRAKGNERQAAAAEWRAGSLAKPAVGRGALTPALSPIRNRVQLTGAERHVARLGASGHTNREIADRLCISVRTVENHLQHVYNKLGIAGRRQLQQDVPADVLFDDDSRGVE